MVKKKKGKYNYAMLIDDSEIDNLINKLMLKGSSLADFIYVYKGAHCALEFLNNIIQQEDGRMLLPDIIFLDINMPVMDGFQFLEALKMLPENYTSQIIVVMLTDSLNPADRERALSYEKVVHFINKPLTLEALEKLNNSIGIGVQVAKIEIH